jgi:hypothetical protein
MRIVRFQTSAHAPASWGWVSDDRIGVMEGSPFGEFRREEAILPLEAARLLAPVVPGKIIGSGATTRPTPPSTTPPCRRSPWSSSSRRRQ